jgi:SAM-dependent methyltransferase
MDDLQKVIDNILSDNDIIKLILSNPRVKDGFSKVDIKKIILKGEKVYQIESFKGKKAFHKNIDSKDLKSELLEFASNFKQIQINTTECDYQILINKNYKVKVNKSNSSAKDNIEFTHNREKNYIIPESIPCAFLIKLGVMNETGKVIAAKYDKFKQINKFLEFIKDVVKHLDDKDGAINIVDFGCGKAYLTFALYHYLHEVLNLKVNIYGLDLKADVIEYCTKVSNELGFDNLKFCVGDIKNFQNQDNIDMVVTLHACDTATDEALIKAVNWNAKVILSVPCCQHELSKQIKNELMVPMQKHGIINERLASLITDSVRAEILEIKGYKVKILEFIDMEHTPKNVLIRAIRKNKTNEEEPKQYLKFAEFWGINPYIQKLIDK